VLELIAVFYALRSFVKIDNVTVLVRVDSSTALSYSNIHGGRPSPKWNVIAIARISDGGVN